MEIELSVAAPEDLPGIRGLVHETYSPYVPQMGKWPAPMLVDYAQLTGEGRVVVARRNGLVIGLLVTSIAEDHVLIENIAVALSERGAGIGSSLLEVAEAQARAAGVSQLRLYTNEAMVENLAYYPRRGFRETGRRHQDGFARVFFSRELSDQRTFDSP